MATVALVQANDQPTRRPPTQGQVGESWHQPQAPAEQPNVIGDTRRPPTEIQVGESWRHQTSAPVRSAEPSGPSGWIVASLSVLAAPVLTVGLAVLANRRAGRRVRAGHDLTTATSTSPLATSQNAAAPAHP
jgi:hypothetical protein